MFFKYVLFSFHSFLWKIKKMIILKLWQMDDISKINEAKLNVLFIILVFIK